MNDLRADALRIYHAALRAADAYAAVQRNLHIGDHALRVGTHSVALAPKSRIVVVGAGKAGARMAQAVEQVCSEHLHGGIVSVKDEHQAPTERIEIRPASHPLPDERSLANGRAIIEQVHGLTHDDVVLCLISGGGSALMEALGDGLSLDHLRVLTRELMYAGADIVQLNCVRKHLSRLKGGQLARWAQPAAVCSLILSDVIGDDVSAIASGPTAPDPTTFAEALNICSDFKLDRTQPLLDQTLAYLERGARGDIAETPKQDDPLFARVFNSIVGSNTLALHAAAHAARTLGYAVEIVTNEMQGEAREVGRQIGAQLRNEWYEGG
ncbi:MAG: glycerate-2-kinase family protein, partial [Chloroflexi bacterium]|nr:glycerate-2-kinase family protein [Chloroflexota bacterium]